MPVAAFSGADRDGADQWDLVCRQLKVLAGRAVVMHGHRHIDWVGQCGVKIVSAPSPIMGARRIMSQHISISIRSRPGQGGRSICSHRNKSISLAKNATCTGLRTRPCRCHASLNAVF